MTSYEVIYQYNFRVILLKTARIYVTEILFQTVNFYIFSVRVFVSFKCVGGNWLTDLYP